jgi:hypothetical protein
MAAAGRDVELQWVVDLDLCPTRKFVDSPFFAADVCEDVLCLVVELGHGAFSCHQRMEAMCGKDTVPRRWILDQMKLRLSVLRRLIHEAASDSWAGSRPEEAYDEELAEDDALTQSVLVPKDVQKKIGSYFKAMGLAGTKKTKKRSRSS